MKNKIISVKQAVDLIKDGDTVMYGGFLGFGTPETIVDAILDKGIKDLTVIGNDTSIEGTGISKLVNAHRVKKVVTSHIGTNPYTGKLMSQGAMEVDLVPQGTLAERIRAAGFGLGGILTPTGLGTDVAQGKRIINVQGKDYLLEEPLFGDVAIIRGSVVDKLGNIYYKGMTNNFNALMAMACKLVIVEAEQIVEVGDIFPEDVKTQGIFVDYIVLEGAK